MSTDEYPSIFSRQMEATVYLYFLFFFILLNFETYVCQFTFIIGVTRLYGIDFTSVLSELNTIITFSSSRRSLHPSGQNSFLEAYNMARSVRCPPYSGEGFDRLLPCSSGIYFTPSMTDTTSSRSTFCRVIISLGRSL